MAAWLSSKLKVAESFLNQVDATAASSLTELKHELTNTRDDAPGAFLKRVLPPPSSRANVAMGITPARAPAVSTPAPPPSRPPVRPERGAESTSSSRLVRTSSGGGGAADAPKLASRASKPLPAGAAKHVQADSTRREDELDLQKLLAAPSVSVPARPASKLAPTRPSPSRAAKSLATSPAATSAAHTSNPPAVKEMTAAATSSKRAPKPASTLVSPAAAHPPTSVAVAALTTPAPSETLAQGGTPLVVHSTAPQPPMPSELHSSVAAPTVSASASGAAAPPSPSPSPPLSAAHAARLSAPVAPPMTPVPTEQRVATLSAEAAVFMPGAAQTPSYPSEAAAAAERAVLDEPVAAAPPEVSASASASATATVTTASERSSFPVAQRAAARSEVAVEAAAATAERELETVAESEAEAWTIPTAHSTDEAVGAADATQPTPIGAAAAAGRSQAPVASPSTARSAEDHPSPSSATPSATAVLPARRGERKERLSVAKAVIAVGDQVQGVLDRVVASGDPTSRRGHRRRRGHPHGAEAADSGAVGVVQDVAETGGKWQRDGEGEAWTSQSDSESGSQGSEGDESSGYSDESEEAQQRARVARQAALVEETQSAVREVTEAAAAAAAAVAAAEAERESRRARHRTSAAQARSDAEAEAMVGATAEAARKTERGAAEAAEAEAEAAVAEAAMHLVAMQRACDDAAAAAAAAARNAAAALAAASERRAALQQTQARVAEVRARLETGEPKRAGATGVSEELGALRGRRDALQARQRPKLRPDVPVELGVRSGASADDERAEPQARQRVMTEAHATTEAAEAAAAAAGGGEDDAGGESAVLSRLSARLAASTDELMLLQEAVEALGTERAAAALRCEAAEATLQKAGGLSEGDPHSEAERGLYVRSSSSRQRGGGGGGSVDKWVMAAATAVLGVRRREAVASWVAAVDAYTLGGGALLRRSAEARIGVVLYVLLLHVWVLVVWTL